MISKCYLAIESRRAGTNLKVGGHNRPALRAGEKFLGVPLHFSAVPLQLGEHFKQWRGGAMACGARANVRVATFSAPSNRGINYVDI